MTGDVRVPLVLLLQPHRISEDSLAEIRSLVTRNLKDVHVVATRLVVRFERHGMSDDADGLCDWRRIYEFSIRQEGMEGMERTTRKATTTLNSGAYGKKKYETLARLVP